MKQVNDMKTSTLLAFITVAASLTTPFCAAYGMDVKEGKANENNAQEVIQAAQAAADSIKVNAQLNGARVRISKLTKIIRKDPTDLLSRRQYVEALLQLGMANQAASEMQRLVRIGLRSPKDFCLLADAYRFSGRTATAMTNYQEALNINPSFSHAKAGLALCYVAAGAPRVGEKVCRDALAMIRNTEGRKELAATLKSIKDQELQGQNAQTFMQPTAM